jgi:hypothetical protein
MAGSVPSGAAAVATVEAGAGAGAEAEEAGGHAVDLTADLDGKLIGLRYPSL